MKMQAAAQVTGPTGWRAAMRGSAGTVGAAALLLCCLLACKQTEEERPTPVAVASAAPLATAAGPCADGTSDDPGQGEFRPAVTSFKEQDYKTAQKLLDNLAEKYPNSATVRVWRGDSVLFDKSSNYKQAASDALAHYREAEKLHDKGCKLPEVEHYYLRMDSAYAHLRRNEGVEAISQLTKAKEEWANSAEVFYHLARAYCMQGDLDACAENFKESLVIAKSLKRPKFLRTHRSLDDWIVRSRTQSEFAKFRVDARYRSIIKEVQSED